MTKPSLLELAERCEKADATEQDGLLREAFDLIAGPQPTTPYGCDAWHEYHTPRATWYRRKADFIHMIRIGAYESAAMTLVPEGFDWILARTNDGLTIHAEVGNREQVFGETPALALCAAALRATEHPHD